MNAFVSGFRWVMLVAGVLTCTMFYAAIAPVASLQGNFGEAIDGPVAQIVVRNWGVLIGLVGLMLIYGAFNEANRRMTVIVALASKVVFIALVLTYGRDFLQFQVGTAVIVDSIIVALFAAYLVGARNR
jgi:energy-converting hydrogenase Eha subunit E